MQMTAHTPSHREAEPELPLIPLDQFANDLRCPRCGAPLRDPARAPACTGSCALAAAGPFPILDGQPVLVDFERSVLSRERFVRSAGESEKARGSVVRRGGLRAVVRDLLEPPNRIAHGNARRLLALAAELAPRPRILVVGGGRVGSGADPLYEDPGADLVAFDIYRSPLVQFVADAHHIPLADGSVHAVWIQAVLEHVLDPWVVAGEIHRVLAPRGLVFAETPFLQHVHEGPYDFTRFTESGHRWLFRAFEQVDSGVSGGLGASFAWSVGAWVGAVSRSRALGTWARRLGHFARVFDRAIPGGHHVDGASGFYFLGRRAERSLTPAEIVASYRGSQGTRPADG
jgi:SAM-dependent methyltransferase